MNKKLEKKWLGLDSMSGRLLAGDPAELRRMDGMVPPRTTFVVIGRPMVEWWQGERLFVHQPIASQFLIHSIRVGMQETTASPAPIPADAFATRSYRLAFISEIFEREGTITIEVEKTGLEMLGMEWPLPPARVGVDVYLVVENISETPARFLAGFLGTSPVY